MSSNLREAMRRGGLVLLTLAALSGAAHAAENEKIRIAVGRAEVVTSNDEVKTVAIADPKNGMTFKRIDVRAALQ